MTDTNDSALDGAGKVGHTPGPWDFGPGYKSGDSTFDLYASGGRQVIAQASYENMWLSSYDKEIDAANARLIAAAPHLLETLKAIEKYVLETKYPSPSTVAEVARVAIAKATGAAS